MKCLIEISGIIIHWLISLELVRNIIAGMALIAGMYLFILVCGFIYRICGLLA